MCIRDRIRASPRKRKDPIARNFRIKLPSKVARKLNVSSVDWADHIPNNSANDNPVKFDESANGNMSFSCSVRDAEMQTEPEIKVIQNFDSKYWNKNLSWKLLLDVSRRFKNNYFRYTDLNTMTLQWDFTLVSQTGVHFWLSLIIWIQEMKGKT